MQGNYYPEFNYDQMVNSRKSAKKGFEKIPLRSHTDSNRLSQAHFDSQDAIEDRNRT